MKQDSVNVCFYVAEQKSLSAMRYVHDDLYAYTHIHGGP